MSDTQTPDNTPEIQALVDAVLDAANAGRPLEIQGGGTKRFYGEQPVGDPIDVSTLTGIVSYDPTELVVTVRAGTRLVDLEKTLADAGQMLPFEPPHFGDAATVGGMVACGLSGPRRPFAGSVRDYVLGVSMVTGRGEHLAFGGQVMKNVAGYDVSRLATGAMGTLGVITQASFKVLPVPDCEVTLAFESDQAAALERAVAWSRLPLPVTAVAHQADRLLVRLAGAEPAVQASVSTLGGDQSDGAVWTSLREQTHAFFGQSADTTLWRLSLPPGTPAVSTGGHQLVEWGGAQRWITGVDDFAALRSLAAQHGGHASAFRAQAAQRKDVFSPLSPVVDRLHRNLKNTFDPHGVLNPGRMYPGI